MLVSNTKNTILDHVAIIMDGNGRWAEQKKSPRSEGHKKGLDNILPIVSRPTSNVSIIPGIAYANKD